MILSSSARSGSGLGFCSSIGIFDYGSIPHSSKIDLGTRFPNDTFICGLYLPLIVTLISLKLIPISLSLKMRLKYKSQIILLY